MDLDGSISLPWNTLDGLLPPSGIFGMTSEMTWIGKGQDPGVRVIRSLLGYLMFTPMLNR